jgi:hypothetical protein
VHIFNHLINGVILHLTSQFSEALLYRWRKEFYQKEGEVFSGSGVTLTLQDAEKRNYVDEAKKTKI